MNDIRRSEQPVENPVTVVRISREEHLRRLNSELKALAWWHFFRRSWLKHLITVLGGTYE